MFMFRGAPFGMVVIDMLSLESIVVCRRHLAHLQRQPLTTSTTHSPGAPDNLEPSSAAVARRRAQLELEVILSPP